MPKPRLLTGILLVLLVLTSAAPAAAQVPIITMSIRAGFDGRFRDSDWMPVIVTVRNDGDAVQGSLVIRPETSGSGITNTFSTPVNLPNGAAQMVTLYVTARSFATQVRVELMDADGFIVAAEQAPVIAVQPLDQLVVVVTQSPSGSVDLTSAALGSYAAFQTNWRVQELPDRASALHPINTILFSDVDTSAISSAQRLALEDWLASGGHLIVTGGASWEPTAAGLADLLPLEPDASSTVETLSALAAWLRDDSPLDDTTVMATGALTGDARVLVEQNGLPLLARRMHGAGTVDYLAVDPNASPLRGWGGVTALWAALNTTRDVQPSWASGFTNWDYAASSTEILPGFNLLPDALPLCGFLGMYIALIGPINYLVLARLNRRELAWLTIPLLIILFSGLAWYLGFNLRGTEATLSRLSVVRVFHDSDRAQVDGLVGLLSPRRAPYDLTMTDTSTLRPIPRVAQGNLLISNVQSTIDVQQTEQFKAANFSVDASFIAGFNTSGVIERPAISGSASVVYEGSEGRQRVRGSVRNDSDRTLTNPVILARGAAFPLDAPLAPGDTEPFDLTLSTDGAPAPALYNGAAGGGGFGYSSYYANMFGMTASDQTIIDLVGEETLSPGAMSAAFEEDRRRRLFLGAFITDFYTYANSANSATVSTGRGDNVYLAGWTEEAPLPLEVTGAQWNSDDTTLYLVELEVEQTLPDTPVVIVPERFTWVLEERAGGGLGEGAPLNLNLQPGDQVAFRYTPLPDAVLSEVERLTVRLERTSIGNVAIPVEVYNWRTDAWESVEVEEGVEIIRRPERFLGPENAVILRLTSDTVGGYLRVDRLTVEQRGTF